jgi:nucleoid DNA-binding protein
MAMIVDNLIDSIQKDLKKEENSTRVFWYIWSENQAGREVGIQTGKEIQIPSTKVPFFRPVKA